MNRKEEEVDRKRDGKTLIKRRQGCALPAETKQIAKGLLRSHLWGNGSFRSYFRSDPGSFRSYSLSVRSFRPGSFQPGSFRPNFGGSFRPTLFYIVFRS